MTGFLFDIVVFGLIITIYDYHKNKRKDADKEKEQRNKIIREYYNQLDDYRVWGEKEGVYRKVGIIKRLVEMNVNLPRLHYIYLNGAVLVKINLEGVKLSDSKLNNAMLCNSNFKGAFFYNAELEGTNIEFANFDGALGLTIEQLSNTVWNSDTHFPYYINVEELEKVNPSVKD